MRSLGCMVLCCMVLSCSRCCEEHDYVRRDPYYDSDEFLRAAVREFEYLDQVMPERPVANVSLTIYSVQHYNRLELGHEYFDQHLTTATNALSLCELWRIIDRDHRDLWIHTLNGTESKSITIDARNMTLRDILLVVAESVGFLYEVRISPSGDVTSLFVHNVDPILRGDPILCGQYDLVSDECPRVAPCAPGALTRIEATVDESSHLFDTNADRGDRPKGNDGRREASEGAESAGSEL